MFRMPAIDPLAPAASRAPSRRAPAARAARMLAAASAFALALVAAAPSFPADARQGAPAAEAKPATDAPPAARPQPAEAPTVFRCATADGRVVFSDEPCVGAKRVEVWSPKGPPPGIAPGSGAPAQPAEPAPRVAAAERADPFIDCQRKGGRYDVNARVCQLPRGAAEKLFKPAD